MKHAAPFLLNAALAAPFLLLRAFSPGWAPFLALLIAMPLGFILNAVLAVLNLTRREVVAGVLYGVFAIGIVLLYLVVKDSMHGKIVNG